MIRFESSLGPCIFPVCDFVEALDVELKSSSVQILLNSVVRFTSVPCRAWVGVLLLFPVGFTIYGLYSSDQAAFASTIIQLLEMFVFSLGYTNLFL